MSITRIFPNSIAGYIQAMNTAKAKKDGVATPADNVLSDATSTRLDTDVAAYNNGKAAIVAAKQVHHAAVELAKPQRKLARKFISSFYISVNNGIDLNTIPASARSFYDLEISNRKMPKMGTDATLITAATALLSGDVARRAAGGVAIASPTIAQVTTILNTARPVILAVSNAKTAVTTAIRNLKRQNAEIKDLIKHVWNEVEAFYSLDDASSIRDQGRVWGIKYRAKGLDSVVTGLCSDSESHDPLAEVKLYIVGVGKRTLSGPDGNYALNTSLYDKLEMVVKLLGYDDKTIPFTKEDGVPLVLNIEMVRTAS